VYRILVVDDHVVVRHGLCQILAEEPDISVVGEAGSAQEALGLLEGGDCDALGLDISLPDSKGLDLLKQIRSDYPRLPVLILSMYSEEQYGLRALRAGAAGYITKEIASTDLVDAIRKVLSGGKYVSGRTAEMLALASERMIEKEPHERLSDRELEVMKMIAAGRTTRDIAEELSLSVKTIGTYRSRIKQKTGLRSTAEIMRYCLEMQVID